MTAKEHLRGLLQEIHELSGKELPELALLRKETMQIIENSDLSYRDIYCLYSESSFTREEFWFIMNALRPIIVK